MTSVISERGSLKTHKLWSFWGTEFHSWTSTFGPRPVIFFKCIDKERATVNCCYFDNFYYLEMMKNFHQMLWSMFSNTSPRNFFSDCLLSMPFGWPRFGLGDCFWKNCVSIPWWYGGPWGERWDRILVQVTAVSGNLGLEPKRRCIPEVWQNAQDRTGLRLRTRLKQLMSSEGTFPRFQLSMVRDWLESHTWGSQAWGRVLGSGNKGGHHTALYWKFTRGFDFYCFTARRRGDKIGSPQLDANWKCQRLACWR